MKRIYALSLLFVLFLLTSCANRQNSDNNYLAVTNSAVDFTFNVPKTWKFIRNDAMIAVQSDESNANISVTSFKQPSGQSVNDYFDNYEENFKTVFKNMEIVHDNEIKADGIPARRITYKNDLGEDHFKSDMVLISRNGVIYTITFTTIPNEYDANVEIFNSALESFKFK